MGGGGELLFFCVTYFLNDPKPRAGLLLTRIRRNSTLQGACVIITSLMKRLEINYQLSKVVANFIILLDDRMTHSTLCQYLLSRDQIEG